jgi:NADH:ubiquinone oxidoreductase subunit E
MFSSHIRSRRRPRLADRTQRNELRTILRERFPRERNQLLPALHYIQDEHGYLPDWAMEVAGWHLGIPSSEVYGAATSYTELSTSEPANHVIKVCTGLGCRAKGSLDLLERTRQELDPKNDGNVSVEEVPCGYMCALAPVVKWNHTWIGRSTIENIKSIASEAISK